RILDAFTTGWIDIECEMTVAKAEAGEVLREKIAELVFQRERRFGQGVVAIIAGIGRLTGVRAQDVNQIAARGVNGPYESHFRVGRLNGPSSGAETALQSVRCAKGGVQAVRHTIRMLAKPFLHWMEFDAAVLCGNCDEKALD